MLKIRLALFASGAGSNALNIIDHFAGHASIEVACVITNRMDAPVIEGAKNRSIPVLIFDNKQVSNGQFLIDVCTENKVNYIILAGYLRLIPKEFAHHYPEKIINVHPALLPNFGGHGMYGDNVHRAVIAAGEEQSGISVHFVDENFDEGRLIAQFYCSVSVSESLDTLKKKVQQLEHAYFPIVIEKTISLQ